MNINVITALSGLRIAESMYRKPGYTEMLLYAKGTGYEEIVREIIPDAAGDGTGGEFATPLYLIRSEHFTTAGVVPLGNKIVAFLKDTAAEYPMDLLSVSVGVEGQVIASVALIRLYSAELPPFEDMFSHTDEISKESLATEKRFETAGEAPLTAEEKRAIREQAEVFERTPAEIPVLNRLDRYIPVCRREEKIPVYDLTYKDRAMVTGISYEMFTGIFEEAMRYVTSVEKDDYYSVLRGRSDKGALMGIIADYIDRVFVKDRRVLPATDVSVLMDKMEKALFDLYIVKDLIDDPEITDIKITDPYSVRVRIRGRAYLSNVTFIDREDYIRFANSIYIRNGIDYKVPVQTFTDESFEDYILRYSITAPYITPSDLPIIHIRKVPRKKPMSDDLVAAGMFDEKIRDYLIDCGRMSSGVVFAGPPGSGKTTCLNWFLEDAYEDSAEILVIQENDELFAYRKGVMFEHVVNGQSGGNRCCTLEDLGRMALVAGANVFVIGEAKGGEMSAAVTLANSGCRTAITIHSPSASQTLDKMADLAMRGYASSYEQAKRMLTCFKTIVYLADYKIQEITEITGYDEVKKDVTYRYIYKRGD